MAQASNRSTTGKASDQVKEQVHKTADLAERGTEAARQGGERVLEAARDATEQTHASGLHLVNETRSAIGRGLGAAADAARASAERAGPAARQALAAETDLIGTWLELGRDQIEHNVEICKRMAAVRDVRELMELQQEYVRLSLSRASQLLFRQIGLASRLFAAGSQTAGR